MVRNQRVYSKMHSTYYLMPGQTLRNTKVSERTLMLLAPQSEFQRLIDHTNERERMAVIAAKEAAKLAAIKRVTYEMSKTWDNTVENIKRRREEELLAKRKQGDDDRVQFVKDMAAKNAEEHAEIVKEARKLLLYKKPQCRLINGALLTSECFRERDAQLAFEKTLRGVDEAKEKEYAELIKKDAENFHEEERQKALAKWKRDRAHGAALKKQIKENHREAKKAENDEMALGRQDLLNMARDLRLIKECETEQVINRKKELRKLVMDAIEQRKSFEMELKRDEEFEDRALEIFERSKKRIEKMKKLKAEEELAEKARHAEFIARKCAAAAKSRMAAEKESIRRAEEERDAAELAKIEARRKYDADLRADRKKSREDAEAARLKREYEERELNNWETLQRFKRDEFNEAIEMDERKRQWDKKMMFANGLAHQTAADARARAREQRLEDDSGTIRAIIEKTNNKVLAYGAQVLEESKGVRPLFPIIKTIEQYKAANGLLPPKECNETPVVKKHRKIRPICATPVPEQEVVYL